MEEVKMRLKDWPVLFVSDQWDEQSDDGFRLDELAQQLQEVQNCAIIPSKSYEDAAQVFRTRNDIGAVVIDWDMPREDAAEKTKPEDLLNLIHERNPKVHVLLLSDKIDLSALSDDTLSKINGTIGKTTDTADFLAGRIEVHVQEYVNTIYPVFFGELVKYAERYKYAWHTPGHLGGQGFLRSPSGVACYKYFGENVFRSDLSISVPELGSLLDHSGPSGAAERHSAKVFGADQTYYVLNGTSTVNQIIWRSQVFKENALVDRNCHKSLNYGMVITEANPVYMVPRRNALGIIGPVRLSEMTPESARAKIKATPIVPEDQKDAPIKMSVITNSTYDGVCYNALKLKEALKHTVLNMHFDEAWYAYAKFHPIYKDHFGMSDNPTLPDDPPIFVSQSTHKLLTAFSQASMLHIRNGGKVKINPSEFNEAYMMHGSTSPQYNMVATLDVATKMVEDNGRVMFDDIIRDAVQIRQKIAAMHRDYAAKGDWFFDMWQPKTVEIDGKKVNFEDAPVDYLASTQKPWVMTNEDPWHGFEDLEEDYVMLDPIKLTIVSPGIAADGTMADFGIPASILTNYLINHNIVCEKTDYYSFLMLNSLGTIKSKQGTLIAALLKFKEDYEANTPLEKIFPDLVAQNPQYKGQGLQDHCKAMHAYLKEHDIMGRLQKAFEVIPDQVMNPADAYHHVVARKVEFVFLDDMDNRVPAVMMVPYPPGIPICMGGEVLNEKAQPILDYLRTREAFEQTFPGYESDIHGVEREVHNGKVCFKTLCIKKDAL